MNFAWENLPQASLFWSTPNSSWGSEEFVKDDQMRAGQGSTQTGTPKLKCPILSTIPGESCVCKATVAKLSNFAQCRSSAALMVFLGRGDRHIEAVECAHQHCLCCGIIVELRNKRWGQLHVGVHLAHWVMISAYVRSSWDVQWDLPPIPRRLHHSRRETSSSSSASVTHYYSLSLRDCNCDSLVGMELSIIFDIVLQQLPPS